MPGFCDPVLLSQASNPFVPAHDAHEQNQKQQFIPYPLDVYYIHAPKCWEGWHPNCEGLAYDDTLNLREAWLTMEAVVGLDHSAARIGLSNVDAAELLDIIEFVKERQQNQAEKQQKQYPPPRTPDVVQIYADPLEPAIELQKICKQHDIEFVSYSTLGTQHMRRSEKNPVLENDVIKSIAQRHGRSAAEVVLSWAIQSGMSVIPRSSKVEHIRELAKLIHSPPFLSVDELARIDSLGRRYTY